MPTPRLTKEIVEAAIFGFQEQKRKLDAQIAELRGLFPNGRGTARPNAPAPKKGMSAAGRKAIAEAQRKRWAAQKAETEVVPAPKIAKRKLSAAGRAAIVAALKKRWAAKKVAAK
jgi:hypothetical protein